MYTPMYMNHDVNLFVPDAIASSDNVRIAPSLKSQKGSYSKR